MNSVSPAAIGWPPTTVSAITERAKPWTGGSMRRNSSIASEIRDESSMSRRRVAGSRWSRRNAVDSDAIVVSTPPMSTITARSSASWASIVPAASALTSAPSRSSRGRGGAPPARRASGRAARRS